MSEKASPAGWVVQVIFPGQPSESAKLGAQWRGIALLGPPSFMYFNVAVAAAEKAIAATIKHLADPQERETSVVRVLSSREIAVLGLVAGEVKPA